MQRVTEAATIRALGRWTHRAAGADARTVLGLGGHELRDEGFGGGNRVERLVALIREMCERAKPEALENSPGTGGCHDRGETRTRARGLDGRPSQYSLGQVPGREFSRPRLILWLRSQRGRRTGAKASAMGRRELPDG